MIQNRERMYLNIVKGIAILLMLWGHGIQYCAKDSFVVFEDNVFQFIYSFHMPLFMLVSGYLFCFSFQKRDLKPLLVHRAQSMLQPIVFANMLNILLMKLPTFLLHGEGRLTDGALFNGLFDLWFLWCVLSSSLAVGLAGKTAANPWLQLLLMFAGVFLVILFPENKYHVYMYPYFVAGFYYGMYRDRIPSVIYRLAWISLAVFVMMVPKYESWHLIYASPVYYSGMDLLTCVKLNGFRWLIGFVGSISVLLIIHAVMNWSDARKRRPAVLMMLAKLGENSLAVYCISISLFSYYVSKVLDRVLLITGRNIFTENMVVFHYLFTPLLAIVYGFVLYAAVQILKKIKVHRLIFGR